MLTGDPMEAIEQARAYLKDGTVADYYEEILLGALRLAQADAELGRLDDVRLENIFKTVSEIVEDLAEHGSDTHQEAKERTAGGKIVTLTGVDFGKPVFCIPGLGRLDDCAALILADALKRESIEARVAGAATAIQDDKAASICVCYLENVPQARIDYAIRRLSRKAPSSRVVVCLLGGEQPSKPQASEQGTEPPHSLKAAVAAFTAPKSRTGNAVGN
jgi:hypothetical protein